jgi:hypothetical protein
MVFPTPDAVPCIIIDFAILFFYWYFRQVCKVFPRLFLEAKKKMTPHTEALHTKVSWLKGGFFAGLPFKSGRLSSAWKVLDSLQF